MLDVPELGRWVYPKSKHFLFPVRVMSKMFRGRFLKSLQQAYQDKQIVWSAQAWSTLQGQINDAGFNVYSKIPFGGAAQIVKYLARYSHRVAITNHRIINMDKGQVSFKYTDYRDGKSKILGLTPSRFCQRFLLHVLPKGFSKIRHFGIYANRSKSKYIDQILMYFERRRKSPKIFSAVQHLKSQYRIDIELCPHCKQGKMVPWNPFMPIRGDPAIAINP